jgi:hypothetical protein
MEHPGPPESRQPSTRRSLNEVATTFDEVASRAPLSSSELDILLKEYAQNVELANNAESHRSTVMSFIFVGIGAVGYALAALKFDPQYWPVAMAVGLLGAFAALLSDIYHERWMYYMMLARGYRWRIGAAAPALRLEEIRVAAKAAHREEFKRRFALHAAWHWLAVGISISGFAYAAMMIFAVVAKSK